MSKVGLIKSVMAAAAMTVTAVAADAATYTYVGTWNVYNPDAPEWNAYPPDGPLAYTGQEAAALVFGGLASDYVISTSGDLVENIDFMAWYDVIGYGGTIFAQDHFSKYLGLYYGPTEGYGYDVNNAASAFVRDNGLEIANYAFRVAAVPLPAGGALLLLGLGTLVMVRRRKDAL